LNADTINALNVSFTNSSIGILTASGQIRANGGIAMGSQAITSSGTVTTGPLSSTTITASGQIRANGGIDLGTQALSGTGAINCVSIAPTTSVITPLVDTIATLSLGTGSTGVNIGKSTNEITTINTKLTVNGKITADGGIAMGTQAITGTGSIACVSITPTLSVTTPLVDTAGALSLGTGSSTGVNIGKSTNEITTIKTKLTVNGKITADGTIDAQIFNSTSDIRSKDIIRYITVEETLNFINNTNPILFKWKDNNEYLISGYIAQEVIKTSADHLVYTSENSNMKESTDGPEGKQYCLNYDGIIPYHGVAIKHLLQENKDLKEEIINLSKKNDNLSNKFDKLSVEMIDLKEVVKNLIKDYD
jgi:hypothetical protein